MPTYEYACRSCGEHLEVVQSFKDEPLRECPRCAGELRKVFGNIGIAFKGSGFYKTDSRSGASKPGADKASKSDKAATPAASDGSGSGGHSDGASSAPASDGASSAPSASSASSAAS